MIPKKIHYCWFGGNPLPPDVKKYIETWRRCCPDYEIKEWNESNFDVNAMLFTREAYALKRYAFVSDVARVKALYDEGGIYLDTDVEVLKPFDLFMDHSSFLGFEMNGKQIGTAVIGSEPGKEWLGLILEYYGKIPFIKYWGKLNSRPNPEIFAMILKDSNICYNNLNQSVKNGIELFPSEYFSAKDYETGSIMQTDKTFAIHHFNGTWIPKRQGVFAKLGRMMGNINKKLHLCLCSNI